MSRPFRFKRFEIRQEGSAMKVGTDGVLLGAWYGMPSADDAAALDIGTGTGLIALMTAQRGEAAGLRVDAVEIEAASYAQATENVATSPWASRVRVHNMSIQDYARCTTEKYALIVSNPPYFTQALKCPDPARTTARHTTELSYSELAACAAELLADEGRFAVILPHEQAQEFIDITQDHGLTLTRRTDVLPAPTSQPKRALMEFAHNGYACPASVDTLVIENGARHEYSYEYRALTKDFYLKF